MKFLVFVICSLFSMSLQAESLQEKILEAITLGATELHIAVIKQDSAKIKTLIKKGTDINVKDDWGWTPLFYAVDNRFFNIAIQLLFKHGADPNVKDTIGWAPLHLTRKVIMAKTLLISGADIHAETLQGRTALELNIIRANTEMVNFLEKEEGKVIKKGELF